MINLQQKFINSKMKLSKNFLYYMIAPLVILLVGIILLFTVGFNLGTDFTGGSTFKIYVNDEGNLENLTQYDLNKKSDYNKVYDKVKTILDDNGLKIVSFHTSTMDISEYRVLNGQAVEVVFKNKATGEDIQEENQALRGQLLTEFDYSSFSNAISSIDTTTSHGGFNYSIEILAGITLGLILVIAYMLLRKYRGLTIMMILHVALDILMLLSLLLITRCVVNFSVGIAVITSFVIAVINAFLFMDKIKNGLKSGKFEGLNNNEMADLTTKEMFIKRSYVYAFLAIITIIFTIVAVESVREIALPLLLVLAVSYYTSSFIMPALWSTIYKPKKLKK